MLSLFSFLFLVPQAIAGGDFTFYPNSGVCFNSNFEQGYSSDLTGTECRDYHEQIFVGKSFEKQALQGSSFQAANLARANFNGADVRGVDFRDANLKGAVFQGAHYDRFTKTDSDVDLSALGAELVASVNNSEVVAQFRNLVVNALNGQADLSDLHRFLTLNPSINIETELDYINRNYSGGTDSKITNALIAGNFAFFDLMIKYQFRFDVDFTYYADAQSQDHTVYLKAALQSGRLDILEYVLKYYSPYPLKRSHLVALLKYMTPATLDIVIQKFPNLLSDPSESKLHFEDPIKFAPNPQILKRLLELQIPRSPSAEQDYPNSFLVNFESTLDFGWLDVPLAFGFDFSQREFNNGVGNIDSWYRYSNKKEIPDLPAFFLELKKRAFSQTQPHGLKVLQSDELSKLGGYIGSSFEYCDNCSQTYYGDAPNRIQILLGYLKVFPEKPNGKLMAGFMGPRPFFYYWRNAEFEFALKTIVNIDPPVDYFDLVSAILNLPGLYSYQAQELNLPPEFNGVFDFVYNKITAQNIRGSAHANCSLLSVVISNSRNNAYDWPFVKLMLERLLAKGIDPNGGPFIQDIAEMVNFDGGLSLIKNGTVEPMAFWSLLNSGPVKIDFNHVDASANVPPSAAFVKFVTGAEEYVGYDGAVSLLNQYKNQIDWHVMVVDRYTGRSLSLLDFAMDHKYYKPSQALINKISELVK